MMMIKRIFHFQVSEVTSPVKNSLWMLLSIFNMKVQHLLRLKHEALLAV